MDMASARKIRRSYTDKGFSAATGRAVITAAARHSVFWQQQCLKPFQSLQTASGAFSKALLLCRIDCRVSDEQTSPLMNLRHTGYGNALPIGLPRSGLCSPGIARDQSLPAPAARPPRPSPTCKLCSKRPTAPLLRFNNGSRCHFCNFCPLPIISPPQKRRQTAHALPHCGSIHCSIPLRKYPATPHTN